MGLTGSDLARMGPAAQRQIMDKLRAKTPAGRAPGESKYHNRKTARVMPNGSTHIFDSQKEARRYDELALLLKAGKIRKLQLQKQFVLQESYIDENGERVRAITYIADFAYERATKPDRHGTVHWVRVVEDVKSEATRTEKYKIKAKLFRERYGFAITEV